MRARRSNPYPFWMAIPCIIFVAIFYLLPVVGGIGLSFTNWDFSLQRMDFIGLGNYRKVLKDADFLKALRNTLFLGGSILVLRNVFAMILALCLNKRQLRTRNMLRTIFFAPSVLSYTVVGVMFVALLRMDGLVNNMLSLLARYNVEILWIDSTQLSLISVMLLDLWVWIGFHMAILLAGMQSISDEYYEAARIDGASAIQQFGRITLPLLTPTIRMSLVLTLIGALRVFEQSMVLTMGGPGSSSMTVNMYVYRQFGLGFYAKASAVEALLAMTIFVLTGIITRLFYQRETELS